MSESKGTTITAAARSPRTAWSALCLYWVSLQLALHWPLNWPPGRRRFPWDKVFHFSAYALLAFLLSMALSASWPLTTRPFARSRRVLFVVAVVFFAGMIDELTQPLTNRDCDWRDLVADTLGALIGASLHALVMTRAWRASRAG